MRQLFQSLYNSVLPVKENFGHKRENRTILLLPIVLAYITSLIVLLLLGKYLWNNYLTKVVTIVKPVDSVLDLLALSILLNLLTGN